MQVKLNCWNSIFLFVSGRMMLLKSVLNAISMYYMVVFKAPKGVVDEFEKVMRCFLGGEGKEDVKRPHGWLGRMCARV